MTLRNWKYTDLFLQPSDEVDSQVQDMLQMYHRNVFGGKQDVVLNAARAFQPPGKMLFLKPVDIDSHGEVEHDAHWIEPEDLMSRGFVISSRMALDHFPNEAVGAIERAV